MSAASDEVFRRALGRLHLAPDAGEPANESRHDGAPGGGAGVVVCAYHANVDYVATLCEEAILRLRAAAASAPALGASSDPPIGTIGDESRLLAVLLQHFSEGSGGEWRVGSDALADRLLALFPGVAGLGGTSAIAACRLLEMGFAPVLHLPSKGEALAGLIPDGVIVPGGSLGPGDYDPPHVILQFDRGTKVSVDGVDYEAPAANRVILGHDTVAAKLRVDPEFDSWVRDNGSRADAAIVCGYNLLHPDIAAPRIDEMAGLADRLRRSNPDCLVHVEVADSRDSRLLDLAVRRLFPNRDSIAMNSEELSILARRVGLEATCASGAGAGGSADAAAAEVLRCATEVARRLNVARLVVHDQHWAIGLTRCAVEEMEDALSLGCLASTARVSGYPDATAATLEAVLRATAVSDEGERFVRSLYAARDRGGQGNRRSEAGGYCVAAVPGRVVDDPTVFVGLGDAFAAGLVAGYVNYRGSAVAIE